MASSRTTVAGHDTAFADGRPGEAPEVRRPCEDAPEGTRPPRPGRGRPSAVPTDLDRER